MALVYRSCFSSSSPGLVRTAATEFSRWLASKGLDVNTQALVGGAAIEVVEDDGTARVVRSLAARSEDRKQGRALLSASYRLEERLPDGDLWRTTLTVAAPERQEELDLPGPSPADGLFEIADVDVGSPATGWVWLDLENERLRGEPRLPGSPRLVRDLLAATEGYDGELPLTAEVLDVAEPHVAELARWLFSERRRVPVLVFAPELLQPDSQEQFARRLARDLAGIAVVVRLVSAEAGSAFTRAVGTYLSVSRGAMRTYLPGLRANEPFPRRHRVLSAASIRALGVRSSYLVRDQVLTLSLSRDLPPGAHAVQRTLALQAAKQSAGVRAAQQQAAAAGGSGVADRQPSGQLQAPPLGDRSVSDLQTINAFLRALLSDLGLAPSGDHSAETRNALMLDQQIMTTELRRASRERAVLDEMLRESTTRDALLLAQTEVELLRGRERESAKLTQVANDLRYELDFAQLEVVDLDREADRLQSRIRWLEQQLEQAGTHVYGLEAPSPVVPEAPDSVAEVLEFAPLYLPRLVIGDTARMAAALDVHHKSERWAIKLWRSLLALDRYAAARSAGDFNNSFLAWCQQPPAGGRAVPATWVALKESQTTDASVKLRNARTFPVPKVVDASGQSYMCAHIKLEQGGVPAPRVHFCDDSGGSTGKVYVGYVGEHLPTANFS